MALPILQVNGHDYAKYIAELAPSREDLDAEGSGRDVLTGTMLRTRIATKLKFEVKLARIPDTVMKQLSEDISGETYSATVLNPITNAQVAKTFYTSAVPFGVQRYSPSESKTYYDGVSFSMIEV